MKYKIEKNVYLAQPEIKTKQDEKQLLSSSFFRLLMKNSREKSLQSLVFTGVEALLDTDI